MFSKQLILEFDMARVHTEELVQVGILEASGVDPNR